MLLRQHYGECQSVCSPFGAVDFSTGYFNDNLSVVLVGVEFVPSLPVGFDFLSVTMCDGSVMVAPGNFRPLGGFGAHVRFTNLIDCIRHGGKVSPSISFLQSVPR